VKVLTAPAPYAGRVPLERIDGTLARAEICAMNVDGIIYADETLYLLCATIAASSRERRGAPWHRRHSVAMPGHHWGYGFPIGGVAAFDPTRTA
jgi:tRNA-splicing ligase RtcB